jgi:hypothetical protein
MNIPSRSERIAFWKHSYARSSFIQAHLFAKLLLSNNAPFRSVLRDALTYSIVTAYGRPFKQRREVRLSREEVPEEHLQLHDEAIEMRDKVIAHRDLDGPIADWGFVSQVQVVADATGIVINTLSPTLENERALAMLPLFAALITLMDEQMEPFLKYLIPLPQPGQYAVSLSEHPAEWLKAI